MMVMTAKVNFKKLVLLLGALILAVIALVMLTGRQTQTTGAAVSDNDARVNYLKSFGWEISTAPVASGRVKIPAESSEIFDRYAQLQKVQGFDLSPYAGKTVMRYVYQITNYPGATEPVYATLLVYKDRIIGGDVTNTGADGKIQGFAMPS